MDNEQLNEQLKKKFDNQRYSSLKKSNIGSMTAFNIGNQVRSNAENYQKRRNDQRRPANFKLSKINMLKPAGL